MKRSKPFVILGALAGAAAVVAFLFFFRGRTAHAPGFDPRAAALVLYQVTRGEGTDLSAGPCLGLIDRDWVVDVAHDPRQSVDDDPANQCPEFREGKARHFVELTPDGRIIRVR